MISAQNMNYDPREALQRFYAGQSVAMDTFRNQTQAAQANAQDGSNPNSPKRIGTPQGVISMARFTGNQNPYTPPVGGESNALMGYLNQFYSPAQPFGL